MVVDFSLKYPRVYHIATLYGFGMRDIELMIEAISNNDLCKRYIGHMDGYETSLRALMVRLGVKSIDFSERVIEIAKLPHDQIAKKVGIRQLPIIVALNKLYSFEKIEWEM